MQDVMLIKRLQKYISEHSEFKSYITGVGTDSNYIYIKNKQGKEARVTIDDLENGRLDLAEFDKEEVKYNYKTLPNGQQFRIVEAPLSLKQDEKTNEEDIEVMEDDFTASKRVDTSDQIEEIEDDFTAAPGIKKEKNMKDLNDMILSKNIDGINIMLLDNFKDSTTGFIDIKGAVDTIMNNCVMQAADSIKDNVKFSDNLSDYNIKGKCTIEPVKTDIALDKPEILKILFRPVHVILQAAKLKGDPTYGNDEKAKELLGQFKIKVDDRLRTITPINTNVQTDDNKDSIQELEKEASKLVLSPPRQAAGFADIFILTIIILVYAAIIINLIMKMR